MLKEQQNFDFKSEMLVLHKKDVFKGEFPPESNEFAFKNGAEISVIPYDSAVVMTAVRDFEDYLFVSMGVSVAVGRGENKNAACTVKFGTDLGEAEGYMGYRITVTKRRISIEGHDERGIAQALYYIEDLMNMRKAPYLKTGKISRKAAFSPRITHSPFGMYSYPDEAFAIMAHYGFDAIDLWLKDANTDKRGYYVDLRLIAERAAKYGIDVYVELYAAHSVHPTDEGAQEFYDKLYGDLFAVCPTVKGVTVVGEATQFHSKDPYVGKAPFTANFDENIPTGKVSPGWWPCKDYPEWVKMIKNSVDKFSNGAEVIFCTYNWGYAPEKERIRLIEDLPEGITLMATWDMFHQYKLGKSVETISDYSLSFVGPGEYFSSEAKAAKKRGLKLYSISNSSGRTWDFGVVPYEPMPYRWLKRYKNMLKAKKEWGLCGLVENIHYGFHPSFITLLEKQAFFTATEPLEKTLAKIIASYFGKENFDTVNTALKLFGDAITHYPPTNEDQYGGFRIGPAYPLWSGVMEGLPSTIPDKGRRPSEKHAMFGNDVYFGVYTPDSEGLNSLPGVRIYDELKSVTKMESLMRDGIAHLEKVKNPNEELERLIVLAKFIANTCRTVVNVKKHYILKQRLSIAKTKENADKIISEMEKLLLSEKENAENTVPLVKAWSRLGWEPSMGYVTDEKGLKWKIRQIDYELDIKLKNYRKANSLKV